MATNINLVKIKNYEQFIYNIVWSLRVQNINPNYTRVQYNSRSKNNRKKARSTLEKANLDADLYQQTKSAYKISREK